MLIIYKCTFLYKIFNFANNIIAKALSYFLRKVKYIMSRYNKNSRKKGGFYVIAAAVLLAAGGIARLSIDTKITDNSTSKPITSKKVYISSSSYDSSSRYTPSTSQATSKKTDVSSSVSSSKIQKTESEQKKQTAATPVSFALPIKGNIQKDYSADRLIYSKTYGDMRAHTGIDIVAKEGSVVKAAGDGKVTEIKDDPILGKTVVIEHSGKIKSYYCGLKDISIKKGDQIKLGRIIGTLGETPFEALDESHLHFAMKKSDEWISPLSVIK